MMNAKDASLIEADNKDFQYTGRIDFSNPKKPKFWSPGVYIQAKFKGTYCDVVLNDEQLYNTSHNYVHLLIDGTIERRLKLTGATNTIRAAEGLPPGTHTITICKDTEAAIGYLEFVGLRCEGLASLPKKPNRKIEFIGDSITAGASSDTSEVGCDKAQWYDQHNAFNAYGPITARNLQAQWHLSAVAGIGLIHSCCDMKITMPEVFDKFNQRENTKPWDFTEYQPDLVTVCLGQNDGIQDPTKFGDAYLSFLQHLRKVYPKAEIVCLSSPMANAKLTAYLKENLTKIVERLNRNGDTKVRTFFFARSYNSGCIGHPDVAEHRLIADELTKYIKTTFHW